jgi:predicted S18 family serine protease
MLPRVAALEGLKRRMNMKKIATLATVITLTAGAAFAGGYSAPVVEAEPVAVEQSGSSGAGLVIPALLLLGVIAAASSNS